MYTKRNRVIARFLLLVFTFTMAMGIVPVGMMGTVQAADPELGLTIYMKNQNNEQLSGVAGTIVLVGQPDGGGEAVSTSGTVKDDGTVFFPGIKMGKYHTEYYTISGYTLLDNNLTIRGTDGNYAADLIFYKNLTVTGTVVDDYNSPIPGASVTVRGKVIDNNRLKEEYVVQTGENGEYDFTGLTGMDYSITSSKQEYSAGSGNEQTITAKADSCQVSSSVLISPKYVLNVTVGANGKVEYTDDAGNPIGAVSSQEFRITDNEKVLPITVKVTDDSYRVESLSINNVPQSVGENQEKIDTSVTFKNNSSERTVSVKATFAKKQYEVKLNNASGGEMRVEQPGGDFISAIVAIFSNPVIDVKPKSGYYLSELKVHEKNKETKNVDLNTKVTLDLDKGCYKYELSNVRNHYELSAVFDSQKPLAVGDYDITFDKKSKVVGGVTYVAEGTTATISPKGDYQSIRVNGSNKLVGDTVAVKMESGNGKTSEITAVEAGTNKIERVSGNTCKFNAWVARTGVRIALDTDMPTIGETLESSFPKVKNKYWEDGKIAYSVEIADDKSGLDESSIKVLDSDNEAVETSLEDGKLIFTPSKAGTYKVSVSDEVGNTSERTFTFYGDNKAPVIKGFVVKKTTASQVINYLSFGIFGNDTVDVIVEAEDNSDGVGVKSITLYVDGKEYKKDVAVDEDNRATFELPLSKITEDEKASYKDIGATATDLLGNKTAKIAGVDNDNLSDENNNSKETKGTVVLETIEPKLEIGVPNAPETINPTTSSGKNFFSGNVDYTITVEDVDSGIEKLDVTLNGKKLDADKNGKRFDGYTDEKHETEEFILSTDQGNVAEDGSYEVVVTVFDNAGNSVTKKEHNYKDDKNPSVSEVNFYGTGNNEGTGMLFDEKHPDYGYFFSSDTEVEVKTTDPEPSSGLNYVEYYLVDVKGKTSATQRELVDADGVARFTIATGFKGQLYVSAVDNVENRSRFLTPDAIVLENNTEHNALDHISFTVPESDKTTATGAPLYSDDVDVAINVMDDVAGIKSVEWSVESAQDTGNNYSGSLEIDKNKNIKYNQRKTEADWEIAATDRNLVTKLTNTMTIKNNSNGIVVYVRITDRAGNVSDNQVVLNIDKTAPVVSVAYDNNAGDKTYGDIFNANRTATITIKERNFSAANVDCTLKNKDGKAPSLSNWTEAVDASNPDNNTYTAKVVFDKDGNYQFSLGFTDLAGNVAASKVENEFIIDKTKPVFKVSYDNDNAQNEKYYASDRTATITVEEHNFDPKRVELLGKATDNGAAVAYPSISSWTSSGDKHSATITYSADALYVFDIAMKDKAGNDSDEYVQEEFYIDKTAPVVEINNVEGANKGDVSPQVSIQDTNYNPAGVDIDLTRVNGAGKPNPASYERGTSENGNGATITYANFPKEKEYDDIYTMNAVVTDMAGNQADANQRFSVNRFGSTYDLTALKEYNGKWYQSLDEDLVFTEMNADPLNNDSLVIKMTKNGSSTELTQGKDFTLKQTGGDGRWSEYEYTIKKDLFNDDAWYSVATYSEDTATNINENIDEEKHADISFGIDKTSPVITLAGLENGETYAEETKTVKAEIKDNMALDTDSVVITVDGKAVDNVKMDSADGVTYVYTFDIQEAPASRIVCVSAADQAGNEFEDDVDHVLITTNAIARLMNNVPMMIAIAVGVVAVGGGAVAVGVAVSGAKAGGAAAAGFKFFKKK